MKNSRINRLFFLFLLIVIITSLLTALIVWLVSFLPIFTIKPNLLFLFTLSFIYIFFLNLFNDLFNIRLSVVMTIFFIIFYSYIFDLFAVPVGMLSSAISFTLAILTGFAIQFLYYHIKRGANDKDKNN